MSALIVAGALVAGVAGALLRYAVTRAFRATPARLPVAVLIVNVVASLVAGVFVALGTLDASGAVRLIAVSGFAGGLSTFSTFGVETVQLVLAGRRRTAIVSVLTNVAGGLAAFAVGWYAVVVALAAANGWFT